MVKSPLIRPYLLGGVALGGGALGSHDIMSLYDTNPNFMHYFKGKSHKFTIHLYQVWTPPKWVFLFCVAFTLGCWLMVMMIFWFLDGDQGGEQQQNVPFLQKSKYIGYKLGAGNMSQLLTIELTSGYHPSLATEWRKKNIILKAPC